MKIIDYQPDIIHFDIPEMDFEDYSKGLEIFIESFLLRFKKTASFYQFGKIRTPGVSDIDLLIVIEDTRDLDKAVRISDRIIENDPILSFLFVHRPVFSSIDLLPLTASLHTLSNCEFISGNSKHIDSLNSVCAQEESILRHIVWNSFMRIAVLDLGSPKIGLRRVLSLMHNILESTHRSNAFLKSPQTINLDTHLIRSEILSLNSNTESIELTRIYIKKVFEAMNHIDNILDMQLSESFYKAKPFDRGIYACPIYRKIFISDRELLRTDLNISEIFSRTSYFSEYSFLYIPKYLIAGYCYLCGHINSKSSNILAFESSENLFDFSIAKDDEDDGYIQNFIYFANKFDFEFKSSVSPQPFAFSKMQGSIKENFLFHLNVFLSRFYRS